jgi:carboxylate-amine ligase
VRDAFGQKCRQTQHCRGGRRRYPFQQWHERRIYDKPRFRELSELYGYLSKQFTILASMCMWAAPMPTPPCSRCTACRAICFIALSASSPCQGKNTAFDSARLNSVFAFPCLAAHRSLAWADFTYFDK